MRIAILFWFYKDIPLCENRLRLLRRHNPHISIFGLYGGDVNEAPRFNAALAPYLDDFYTFAETDDPQWKWQHGDLMINHWYRQRGNALEWDTIFIAQWDMVVTKPVGELFKGLQRDELLLSGLRPVTEVEDWWWWIKAGTERREEYQRFLEYMRTSRGYDADPLCCQFIVACLPRSFLERYSHVENAELGFLEYKIPMYAQLFGHRFFTDHPFNPWWADDPTTRSAPARHKVLNADVEEVGKGAMLWDRYIGNNVGIYHPVTRIY